MTNELSLPPYHQVYITFNGHRTNYETVESYIDCEGIDRRQDMTPEEINLCIALDSIVEIQLYPISPISFHWVAAATFIQALKMLWDIYEKEKWDEKGILKE